MKHKLLLATLCATLALTACGTEDEVSQKQPEVTENQESAVNEPQQEEASAKEIHRFALGDTVVVSENGVDLYELTFDKAFLTDERNEYYENEVENVVVLEYTYKNLNEESGTYITNGLQYKIYDSEGKSLETYPAGVTLYGDTVSIGRTSTAQEAFGFNGDANQTLEIEIYNDLFSATPLAIVEIQPQ